MSARTKTRQTEHPGTLGDTTIKFRFLFFFLRHLTHLPLRIFQSFSRLQLFGVPWNTLIELGKKPVRKLKVSIEV